MSTSALPWFRAQGFSSEKTASPNRGKTNIKQKRKRQVGWDFILKNKKRQEQDDG